MIGMMMRMRFSSDLGGFLWSWTLGSFHVKLPKVGYSFALLRYFAICLLTSHNSCNLSPYLPLFAANYLQILCGVLSSKCYATISDMRFFRMQVPTGESVARS